MKSRAQWLDERLNDVRRALVVEYQRSPGNIETILDLEAELFSLRFDLHREIKKHEIDEGRME